MRGENQSDGFTSCASLSSCDQLLSGSQLTSSSSTSDHHLRLQESVELPDDPKRRKLVKESAGTFSSASTNLKASFFWNHPDNWSVHPERHVNSELSTVSASG